MNVMKKKVLLATVALFVLIAGVVSAASIWGSYKGYDIIRLTVDGKTIKATDAPAISFNNRTMVPIYMLSEAGINFSWDGETKTVNIKSPMDGDAQRIRSLARIANYYDTADELGGSIAGLSSLFEVVYGRYVNGTDLQYDIDDAFDGFNNQVNRYNDRLQLDDMAALEGKKIGIDTSDLTSFLNDYYTALEYFRASLDALEEISVYGNNQTRYTKYFDNASAGLKLAHNTSLSAYKKYLKYIDEATK
jgi:hypothetical protein